MLKQQTSTTTAPLNATTEDMPRANRGRRLAAAVACPHCGRVGHSSNLCPRDDYSPDIPALTCSQCVRRVTTATGGDTNFEIYIGVDPCAQHATLTAQPPTQAATSSFSQTVASLRPPSYSAATSSSSTSNPTSVGVPVQCPCYSPTPYDSSYQCCPSQCSCQSSSNRKDQQILLLYRD